MTYAIIFVVGALAMLMLRRLFVILIRGTLMIVGVALAGRLALMVDGQPNWLTGGLIGGVVAFVIVGVLSYVFIYHALIAADEQRDIDRAHETAKRRRLW